MRARISEGVAGRAQLLLRASALAWRPAAASSCGHRSGGAWSPVAQQLIFRPIPGMGRATTPLRGVYHEQPPYAEGVVQLGAVRRPARIDVAQVSVPAATPRDPRWGPNLLSWSGLAPAGRRSRPSRRNLGQVLVAVEVVTEDDTVGCDLVLARRWVMGAPACFENGQCAFQLGVSSEELEQDHVV
jgi:hypothetical protein